MPRSEVAFVIGALFAGDEGRAVARRIDERVHRLPGLAGLHLVERAVERHGRLPGGPATSGRPGAPRWGGAASRGGTWPELVPGLGAIG
jgi:hypothetical protein